VRKLGFIEKFLLNAGVCRFLRPIALFADKLSY